MGRSSEDRSPEIVVTFDLAKVRRIEFCAAKPNEHEMLFTVWPLIQPLIAKIDRRLRKNMQAVVDELKREQPAV